MKKKLFTSVMAGVLSVSTCFGLVGCGGGGGGGAGANNENTLQIYICNYGYGYKWLYELIPQFKQQAWVKEKYGVNDKGEANIDIPTPYKNAENNYAQTMIEGGAAANVYDLLFTNTAYNNLVFNGNYEELTPLLSETVPGEGVTVGEKMKPDILNAHYVVEKTQYDAVNPTKHLFGMPWVDSYESIVVNDTLVRQELGSSFSGYPRTTSELVSFAESLKVSQASKAEDDRIAPFCFSGSAGYWQPSLQVWWAQYEGLDTYHDYFRGYDESGRRTADIAKQKGKLYALEALENIIYKTNGYNHSLTNLMTFSQSQTKFLIREGFMAPNGDWLENEMQVIADENPYKDDKLIFIKRPIVSAVVEKLDLYVESDEYSDLSAQKKAEYDAKLIEIIDQIDAEKTYEQAKTAIAGLTQHDYDKVYAARYTSSGHNDYSVYIPSYASAKGLAKDFLLFMSTDTAIKTYMKANNGCTTPYQFDTSKLDFELSPLQKSVAENKKTGYTLLPMNSFPLNYYGGLIGFPTNNITELLFCEEEAKDRMTAEQVYEADITYTARFWDDYMTKTGF